MVVALRHNQQALLENQRALNRAQIRMLQAQLNPHFLCNTLDTMKWISKINQVPQVALMSTNLADILRFCITPDEFVPPAAGVGDFEPVRRDSAHPPVGKLLIHGSRAGGASFVHGSEKCSCSRWQRMPFCTAFPV